MAIAILGWGSLIWDLDVLAPHVTGDWAMGAGPRLPMEFCRISPKRKMGLVVCLDAAHGEPCATHSVQSTRAALDHARHDLAVRERAPIEMIGSVDASGAGAGRGEIRDVIAPWCRGAGFDGAVWTDLRSNYAETRGEGFTLARGAGYLRGLSGESLDEAVGYIARAPRATDTPLRRLLSGEDWWQGEVARLGL